MINDGGITAFERWLESTSLDGSLPLKLALISCASVFFVFVVLVAINHEAPEPIEMDLIKFRIEADKVLSKMESGKEGCIFENNYPRIRDLNSFAVKIYKKSRDIAALEKNDQIENLSFSLLRKTGDMENDARGFDKNTDLKDKCFTPGKVTYYSEEFKKITSGIIENSRSFKLKELRNNSK